MQISTTPSTREMRRNVSWPNKSRYMPQKILLPLPLVSTVIVAFAPNSSGLNSTQATNTTRAKRCSPT
ncbi:hypothetical protein Mapa_004732 [Marchantia paleacea]|nr:hypothetical protein Mapa_004732 [Marchantia paleacea]